jgi:hypothetical protein
VSASAVDANYSLSVVTVDFLHPILHISALNCSSRRVRDRVPAQLRACGGWAFAPGVPYDELFATVWITIFVFGALGFGDGFDMTQDLIPWSAGVDSALEELDLYTKELSALSLLLELSYELLSVLGGSR